MVERKRRGLGVYTAEAVVMTLIVGLIGAGVLVGWIIGHYATPGHTKTVTVAAGGGAATVESTDQIAAAPNFSAADLSTLPTDNWPTVGGNLMNERYSPLDQISTDNISQVKGIWRTHLKGSAIAAKYSAESQPVVYKGVIYISTGNDDVFAVSVATGKILWNYSSNLNQKISTVCCGWLNRGVAIGDGRVYFGQLDGNVVALDQKTGKVLWKNHLVKWQLGQTITAAPIYIDHKIYIGVVGAEYATRSFLAAIDAGSGKEVWRWYTTAAPGEPGGNTWPAGSKQYLRGGATIWQAPAVDPKLGLIYFSTGNAGSDWFGGDRPGKNLYAASIVALDLKSGKLKWYYQQVHHDIWDFDSASPVVLFNAGGHQGIAQASKTGWLYMLDRATGKPLYGIPEKQVPQNRGQATWPTQPIPDNAAFTPHGTPPKKDIERVLKEAKAAKLGKKPVVIAHTAFTPGPVNKLLVYGNGPQGGVNWQPISFNEKTNMFYICSSVSWVGFVSGRTKFVRPGVTYNGALGAAGVAWPEASGTLTAIDGTSGKVAWQERFPEPCYAGTATTAGNLLFVGRNSGELEAYNATTGKRLWRFQTGAGANDTATIFQQDGKEYIAFLSGGNSLGATPHGDSLWLFGLGGKLGPAPTPGPGQGTQHAGEKTPSKVNTGTHGDVNAGSTVFASNCVSCHGATGHGGNGGPDLTIFPNAKNMNRVVAQVENGGGGMPAFKGQLTAKQITDVATYVTQKITNHNK